MQHCNLRNLPENYTFKYYLYHVLSWPQLLYVAEAENGKIVGYVMAKLEDDDDKKGKKVEAHITSLSVLHTHRKLGIATRLMRQAHKQMMDVFHCDSCSLRVRITNRAAYTLYSTVLGYTTRDTEKSYYADGEDAFDMQMVFKYGDEQNVEESKESESTADQADSAAIQYAESNQAKDTAQAEQPTDAESATSALNPNSKAAKNKKKRERAKANKKAAAGV